MEATPISIAAPARRDLPATAPEAPAKNDSGEGFWGDDGFTFGDILDLINPFHHVPVVSTLYRASTGDDISTGARLLGGALFGGIIGFFGAIFSVVVESATGKDLGEHALALFEDTPPEPNGKPPSVAAAATAPPPAGEPVASTTHAAPAAETAPATDTETDAPPGVAAAATVPPPAGELVASTTHAPPLWLARTPRARVDSAVVAAHYGSPAAIDWVLESLDESLDMYARMRDARDAYEPGERDVVATRLDATL